MNVTELLVTGFDGPCMVFATTLTADEAKVMKPGTGAEGEPLIGEAWEKATEAFAAVRDLMIEVVGEPVGASS